MKKNIMIGTVTSLLITAFAIPAMAYENPSGHGEFLKDLNLTAAQRQEIDKMRQSKKSDPNRAQLRTKMEALRNLKSQNPVDQAKVNAKLNEIKSLRAQFKNDRQDDMKKLQSILTPAQFAQLKKDIQSLPHEKGHFPGKNGFGHHNGEGPSGVWNPANSTK
ncbi:MAG TPA: Spy/CpxP family protein refolding chaperone [Bacillota bacterium]|nr:Spy/CpxP family protein refolding chaperone [Bacillota bacterium]